MNINDIKLRIKQKFCKHDPIWVKKKPDPYSIISGEEQLCVCKKCGKLLDTDVIPWD